MESTENKIIFASMRISDFSGSCIFEHIFYSDDDIASLIYQGENFWIMETHPTFEAVKNYVVSGSDERKLTLVTYHKRPALEKPQLWQMIYRFRQHGSDLIKAVHIMESPYRSAPEIFEDDVVTDDGTRDIID